MMKTRYVIFLILITAAGLSLITFQSCSKKSNIVNLTYYYTPPKIYVSYPPKSLGIAEITLYTGKIIIPVDSILTANHIPSGIIQSATLTKLKVVMSDPPDSTFKWLSSARVLGCVDSTFLNPATLGSAPSIAPGSTTIDFLPNSGYSDLTPVLYKESYFIRFLATPSGIAPPPSAKMYLTSEIRLIISPI